MVLPNDDAVPREPPASVSGCSSGAPGGTADADRSSPMLRGTEMVRIWDSTELFGDFKEILIHHGNDVYRLRRTRNQKLILQK